MRKGLPDLFRHFPYVGISAQFFPLYAFLYAAGEIDSPAALLLMAPFVFSHAAGFAYNNLADRGDPAFKKNPIAEGMISVTQARWIIAACTAVSIALFGLLYRTPGAWLCYLLYLLLGFAYSGVGVRLKETLAGPFVAAFTIWAAGPWALALEYDQLGEQAILSLLAAIYLIYLGREIYHTIIDFENDLRAGYRTFAVRTSSIVQRAALASSVSAGALGLLLSIQFTLAGAPPNGIALLTGGVVVLAAGIEALYCLRHAGFHPATAFTLLRAGFILYAALILELPALAAAFLVWAFLMGGRS